MDKRYFNKKYQLSYLLDILCSYRLFKNFDDKLVNKNDNEINLLADNIYFHVNNFEQLTKLFTTLIENISIDCYVFKHFLIKFKPYIAKNNRLPYLKEEIFNSVNYSVSRQFSNSYHKKIIDKYFLFLDFFQIEPTLILHNHNDYKNNMAKKIVIFLTNNQEDERNEFFYALQKNLKNQDSDYHNLYTKIANMNITWIEFSLLFGDKYFDRYKKINPFICLDRIKRLIKFVECEEVVKLIDTNRKSYLENIYLDLLTANNYKNTKTKKI